MPFYRRAKGRLERLNEVKRGRRHMSEKFSGNRPQRLVKRPVPPEWGGTG
jgi:hypothetical protein